MNFGNITGNQTGRRTITTKVDLETIKFEEEQPDILRPIDGKVDGDKVILKDKPKFNSQNILNSAKEKGIDLFKAQTIEEKKAAIPYLMKLANSDAPEYMIEFYKSVLAGYQDEVNKSGQSQEPPEIQQARKDLKGLQDTLKNINSAIQFLEQQRYNKEITDEEFGQKRSAFEKEKQNILIQIRDKEAKIAEYEKTQMQGNDDAEAAKIEEYRKELDEREQAIKNLNQKIQDLAKVAGQTGNWKDFYKKAQELGQLIGENTKRCEELRKLISDYESTHKVEEPTVNKTTSETTTEIIDGYKYETTTTKDADGNVISEKQTSYDENNVKLQDLTVNYDKNGQITDITEVLYKNGKVLQTAETTIKHTIKDDNNGTSVVTRVEKDANGKVIHSTETVTETTINSTQTNRKVTTTEKDANGDVVTITESNIVNTQNNQSEISITKDAAGNLVSTFESSTNFTDDGTTIAYSIVKDAAGNTSSEFLTEINADGSQRTTAIQYDENSKLETSIEIDANGKEVSQSTIFEDIKNGTKTTYDKQYNRDNAGNITSIREVMIEYNADGTAVEHIVETDASGNVIFEQTLDVVLDTTETNSKPEADNTNTTTETKTLPSGATVETVTVKDSDGNIVSITETLTQKLPNGKTAVSVFTKDETGKQLSEQRISYDATGRKEYEITDTLDDKGRVASSKMTEYSQDGYITETKSQITYGANGNKTIHRDEVEKNPSGKVFRTAEVDTEESAGVIKEHRVMKNAAGEVEAILNSTRQEHDDGRINQTIVKTDAAGQILSTYIYTSERTADGGRKETVIQNDTNNYEVTETVRYYDKNGNLVSETNGTKSGTETPSTNNTTAETNNNTAAAPTGKTTTETETVQIGSITRVTTTEKDESGNIVSEKVVDTNADGKVTRETTTTYTRDAKGNLLSKLVILDQKSGPIFTTTTDYERDKFGNILSETEKTFSEQDSNFSNSKTVYERDAQGNLLSKNHESYNHGQLMSKHSEEYTNGKLTKTYSYSLDNNYNKNEETVYYDEHSNMTQIIKEVHDKRGNFSYKNITNNSYSATGIMQNSTITSYDADGKITSERTTYYDKDGKEITKTATQDIKTNDARYTVETKETPYYNATLGGNCKIKTITQKDKATGQAVAEKVVYLDASGNEVKYTLTEYHANGKVAKVTEYNNEPRTFGKQYSTTNVTLFDEDGNKLYESSRKQYEEYWRYEFTEKEYYPNGQIKHVRDKNNKEIFYNEDGSVRT